MKIQWYPGHMTKAKRAMAEDVKIIDLIIEMTDARAPLSTRNPDIDQLGQGKARLIILNKADAADERANRQWEEYFQKLGYECLMMDSREKKSIKQLMAGKATAKTGNKPGVTKGNQWIRLNKSVELLDTPGILWPKFEDQHVGEMIAFIGSINDMIIDTRELGTELIRWFLANRPEILRERFEIEDMDEHEALIQIAKLRGCIIKGNEYDYDKAASIFINEFRSGKLGKITLEWPPKRQEEEA